MALLTAPPAELKSSEWKKKKSVIAKVVKRKTGITEALTDFEKAHGTLDAALNKALNAKDSIQALTKVEKGELDACYKKLEALKKLAYSKASEWEKKTCPVPKKTRVYTEKIFVRANNFRSVVDKDFADVESNAKDEAAREIKDQIKRVIARAKPLIDDLKGLPTAHNYNGWMAKGANPADGILPQLTAAEKSDIDLGFNVRKATKDFAALAKLSKLGDDATVAKAVRLFEAKLNELECNL